MRTSRWTKLWSLVLATVFAAPGWGVNPNYTNPNNPNGNYPVIGALNYVEGQASISRLTDRLCPPNRWVPLNSKRANP